jgi:hypothetical protein
VVTAVAQWLRCCATNRKVAGSISAGVSGFFNDIKFFRSHYGPGVDSALTEMSTKSISWGKGGRCGRLATLPPCCAVVMKSGSLSFLELSGHLGPVTGLLYFLPFLQRQFRHCTPKYTQCRHVETTIFFYRISYGLLRGWW